MRSVRGNEGTLRQLIGILEAHNPELISLLTVESEKDFVGAVEQGLLRAILTIQGGASQYGSMGERGLSLLLADLMNHSGFSATAERFNNGHVDLVIEHLLAGRWRYLGECKIYNGYQYHVDGCQQVLGYCSGVELRAFCLDFVKSTGGYELLKRLRSDMDERLPLSQNGPSTDHSSGRGAFVTLHPHRSGSEIEVMHVVCIVSSAAGA